MAVMLVAIPFSVKAAYQVETLPDNIVYNDFVVGPGKIQVDLKPGDTRVINIIISNRLGVEKLFSISTEDIKGTQDPNQSVVLLGSDRGPYSLKDYLKVDSYTFNIDHAQRVTVPVTIHVPADAQPGGLYGSVIITTQTTPDTNATQPGSVGRNPIVTRIGTLFFIRVAGDIKQEGKLAKFSLKNDANILWENKSVDFKILYENTGSVHNNPYGGIVIKNMLGSTVGTFEVEPWFALPESLRLREISWTPKFLFGRYTATAEINRGYGNKIDTASISFWVIPWKIILGVFIIILLIGGLLKWVFSKFTISRK